MKSIARACSIGGGLLAVFWLVWALLLSDKLAHISKGVIRTLTLPGEADAWPTRDQDLANLFGFCLPFLMVVLLMICSHLMMKRNQNQRRKKAD